jgi:hypothetical protein
MWLAESMHRSILPAVLLSLFIQTLALAQSSPSAPFDNNLGSWTWGKQQPPPSEDHSDSGEDDEEGRGETSWERMSTERSEETEHLDADEEPKQLTPLDLWRFIWSKISKKE